MQVGDSDRPAKRPHKAITMQPDEQRHAAATNGRDPTPETFLRLPQVLARIPVSNSTLWGWVKAGHFPEPVKIGPMTTAWRGSEVDAWMREAGKTQAQLVARRGEQ